MKISAVVPAFDRAGLLPRTLASIANQTHDDVEVIVVDDGSRDATPEVLSRIAATFERPILTFRKPNQGCAAARNAGLRHATGDCVAFLDSDDEWRPDALSALADVLVSSGADFVYSPSIEVRADGSETVNPPVAAGAPERLAADHFEVTNLRNGASLFRREIFSRVGDFDTSLGHNEDSDLMQRIAILCKAAYCETPSVRVHHHGERKSGNRVAVQRAVLHSSEKILSDHPEFARILGARADERLRRIRRDLIEALVLAGDVEAARTLGQEHPDSVEGPAGLALRFGSNRPVLAVEALRRIGARISGRLRALGR